MRCVRPIQAWQTDGGQIVFAERGKIRRSLTLRCGQCVGCRLERSRQWAVRCMHEAQLHLSNSFVTLTYDDEHVPRDGSLRYSDFQYFMKRLRLEFGPTRFYMCGEYGEQFRRPHFHACLFGLFFPDRVLFRETEAGSSIFTSVALTRLWPHGFSSVGDVTFESAAYVARYVMKKVTGQLADAHYSSVDPETGEVFWRVPEFTRMSLKPGIGAPWMDKFYPDVFPNDYVVVRGRKCRPPRYYQKWLTSLEDCLTVEGSRAALLTDSFMADSTPERLAVVEAVAKSRLSFNRRSLE
ncbi:MAG: replication initiator protein [Microvirus sp.]|nr:MAG: replication initiator protein [Microvirus sp.]